MAKLACICDNIIRDQTDSIPYKAHFYRDQDYEHTKHYLDDIADFVEAIKEGQRNKWIREYFKSEFHVQLTDRDIINDIGANPDWESIMYQCESCGRIWIQRGRQNRYLSFLPEEEDGFRIFDGLSNRKC